MSKIIAKERFTKRRKVREGIESVREKSKGNKVLNRYDHVEEWKDVLNTYFNIEKRKELEKDNWYDYEGKHTIKSNGT